LSGSGVAPSVALVTEFLVELYFSPPDADAVERLAECARIAAEEQRGRGVSVRYVRSISLPEEETCFVFYEAPSREAVSETARLAKFAVVCIAAAESTEAKACGRSGGNGVTEHRGRRYVRGGHRWWLRSMLCAATMSAALIAWPVTPASAALADGTSVAEHHPLPADVTVPPTVGDRKFVVMTVLIGLQAGQSRRVSDQLTLSLTDSNHPEVDNDLACLDSSGRQIGDESNGGTNDQAVSALAMRASMILTADHTDIYQCQIKAYNGDSHSVIARAGTSLTQGTFLDVDNFTADPPGEWEGPFCPSNDSQPPPWPTCLYFGGGQFAPTNSRILFDDGPTSTWTAVDVAGQLQVTSCFYGTHSCRPDYYGDSWFGSPADDDAVFRTHMELIQQDAAGNPCAVTRSAELTLDATNDIHHLLVNYQIPAPVFTTCGGSRTFKVRLLLDWVSGNPLKIDSGTATRANVIVRQTGPTTTVPDAVGIDQTTAAARVQGAGLTIGLINSVVDPAPPGTVIAQNAPAGTVEPTGSAVNLTVSLGSVTVPDVEDDTQTAAVQALSAAGLIPTVGLQQACINPGHVISQEPAAGTHVRVGATTRITVDTGNPRTCINK
jgi:PASTA domain